MCLYLIVHTYFSFLPPPASQVTTNPSSISIKLVSQECFLNRLMQHILFCDDFSPLSVTLSRSIHILCIKISFIEITEHCNVQGSEQITACSYLNIKGHLDNFRLGVVNKVAINFHITIFYVNTRFYFSVINAHDSNCYILLLFLKNLSK